MEYFNLYRVRLKDDYGHLSLLMAGKNKDMVKKNAIKISKGKLKFVSAKKLKKAL